MSSRKKALIGTGAAIVVLVAAGAVFALTRGGDVSNPNVEFQDEPTSTPVPDAASPPAHKGKKKKRTDPLRNFVWPTYGYTDDRRRYLDVSWRIRPPFKRRWFYNGHALLEFPPVMALGKLFLLKDDGTAVALNKATGRIVWQRKVGTLAAASPGYGGGWVFVPVLNRARGKAGAIEALRARDGKVMWTKPVPSRTESSPLVDGSRVYVGSEDGTVYALRTSNGHVVWTFHASGAVKGGVALSQGRLYFGDYSGRVYAIRASNGAKVWSTGTSGSLFGLRSGQFYSSPAVAFGRVYIGNTDGRMYSFSADKGKLAWTKSTGSYVYASPAVAKLPGGRPTVYFGSYDGTFYAVDARSGSVRWEHRDGGKISGSPTIIGNIVYFSNLGRHDTTGLNARSGRQVFHFRAGAFNPVISDGRDVFLTGNSSVTSLRPRLYVGPAGPPPRPRTSHQRSSKRRSERSKRKAQRQHRQQVRRRHAAARRHRQKQSQGR
jgi:outer membrane protein assembly factor BamB